MARWVVVGGGSAGCVVAARLSERTANEVVLLEAGPDHGTSTDVLDAGPYLTDPSRLRTDEVTRRPGAAPVQYLRGHGLGGSSLINGGVVTDPALLSDHVLPFEDPWADGPVGSALLATDPAAHRVRLVRRAGRRVTAADAYLRPVMLRPNLEVRTAVDVQRVLVADRRVVGVETGDGRTIEADRVVMCAGAIHTPAVLLRSGVDTPGIGDGLQDHPAFAIALRLNDSAVDAGAPTVSVVANHPDHQIVALNHVAGVPDLGALMVALTSPRSQGSVRLPDPAGPPVVELDQLADPRDLDVLAAAVRGVVEMLDREVWRTTVSAAYIDDRGTQLDSITASDAALRTGIADHVTGHCHAAATCREGVVTDAGRVRGYTGLYVADASAFAALPPRDPYLHVLIQADRLASSW